MTAPAPSRASAFAALRSTFRQARLAEPDLDARLLLLEACGIDATELALRPETLVDEEDKARLQRFTERRLAGEPVGRILGRRGFWGLEFALGPAVLEPRPDSEIVVVAALALVADRGTPLTLLDLGTGSGCLLVALLAELPNATGIGLDRAAAALPVARRNADAAGLGRRAAFLAGDWAAALAGHFDLVVANPPYIRSDAIAGLASEVRAHDPIAALDGGADGLDAYRALLADMGRLIVPGGGLVLEVGFDQADDVSALVREAGFGAVTTARDLGGRQRAVTARAR